MPKTTNHQECVHCVRRELNLSILTRSSNSDDFMFSSQSNMEVDELSTNSEGSEADTKVVIDFKSVSTVLLEHDPRNLLTLFLEKKFLPTKLFRQM